MWKKGAIQLMDHHPKRVRWIEKWWCTEASTDLQAADQVVDDLDRRQGAFDETSSRKYFSTPKEAVPCTFITLRANCQQLVCRRKRKTFKGKMASAWTADRSPSSWSFKNKRAAIHLIIVIMTIIVFKRGEGRVFP
jgi:hypothetical protein